MTKPNSGRAAISKARASGKDSRVKTRIRMTRIAAFLCLAVLLFVAPSWGRTGPLAEVFRWAGYAALIVGVMGRVWCTVYIGGLKSQLVIDVGPYSMMRNPLYFFSFVGLVGVGLSTGMLAVTAVLAVIFMLYYRGVVAGEEAFLKQLHDADYDKYFQRVPRWLPNPRLYREAAEPMALPRNVLITMIESSTFFLAPPLFALIAWFQDTGVLPVLFRLQ